MVMARTDHVATKDFLYSITKPTELECYVSIFSFFYTRAWEVLALHLCGHYTSNIASVSSSHEFSSALWDLLEGQTFSSPPFYTNGLLSLAEHVPIC